MRPPQSMCIETDERGSDREQHASCRMKPARAQAICPLVRDSLGPTLEDSL